MEKILITTSTFCKMDTTALDKLQKNGYRVVLNPYERKLTESEVTDLLIKHQPVAMIAGVEPITESVLRTAKSKLKIISRCGIGLESVDIAAAKKFGIIVTNTPDAPTIPVAELTLALILGVLRRPHISDASIRAGYWERPMGYLLHGKTVGIIGCGRIGTHLAKILSGFDCKVVGTDPACIKSNYFELIELDKLLKISDIVSLHIPDDNNEKFMNENRIQLMKKGSYLINTARGGLIDEESLYMALKSGHLAGAAIDTFINEPYSGSLIELDNVLLTGHIGSYARESRVIMEKQAVDNLLENL